MQRYKSTPWDDLLAADENTNPIDRCAAIARLTVDQLHEFEPLFARLLTHQSADLRGRAACSLLGSWSMEHYLEPVIAMLHHDPEYIARNDAAFALHMYAQYGRGERECIVRELAKALLHDPDWRVQQTCYMAILKLIPNQVDRARIQSLMRPFERETDVDWELVRPYLQQQGDQK